MTTSKSQTCPRCHGKGRNPEDSLLGWPGEPCYICHGTGQLTPDLVNIGEEKDTKPTDDRGPHCSGTGNGTGRIEATDTPMGVSQWKAHGIKYGYWDYFAKNPRTNDTEVSGPDNQTERVPANPNSTTEDMGELEKQVIELLAEYSTRLDLKILDGRLPTEAVMPRFLALIAAHDRVRLDAVLEAIGRDEINDNNYNETWAGMRKGSPQSVRDSFRAELRTAVKAIFKMEDGK